MGEQMVLDPCCGSRMMWFDKSDPRTIPWVSDGIDVGLVVVNAPHRVVGRAGAHRSHPPGSDIVPMLSAKGDKVASNPIVPT